MTRILCDRCKRELPEATQNIAIYAKVKQYHSPNLPVDHVEELFKVPLFYDLCEDCLAKVKSVIENGQEQ